MSGSRRLPLLVGGLTLVLSLFAMQPAHAAADLAVSLYGYGPGNAHKAGLSTEFNAGVVNRGDTSTSVELIIILAGQLAEPEHIFAGMGFDCEVRHDTGINAAIRCTGQLEAGFGVNVQFHARGLAPGVGKFIVTANPDRSVPESNFDNNFDQRDITFN